MLLFADNAGRVVRVNGAGAAVDLRYISTPDDELVDRSVLVIVTRVATEDGVEVQFTRTGRPVYANVSGDKLGALVISGLAFAASCDSQEAGSRHGIADIREWFRRNKASNRESPVTVVLVSDTVSGLATNLSTDTSDPSTNVIQFNLSLTVYPEN